MAINEKSKDSDRWSYEGNYGPAHWADLSPDFSCCRDGKKQSPIDIISRDTVKDELPELTVKYKPAPLRMINDSHSIQINYEKGSFLTLNGKKYQLVQFHFYCKSEHTINGKYYPMEAHFVHVDEKGKVALVLGVFIKSGKKNEFLRDIWNFLPSKQSEEFIVHNTFCNAEKILPQDLNYYNYDGSLTTPGCDEGINWIIFKKPIEISKEQIEKFAAIFPKNFRPVQPLNKRKVRSL